MATPKDVLKMISDNEVKFIDFRFTDTRGKEQHVSVPHHQVDEDKLNSVMPLMAPRSLAGRALKPLTCC